MRYRLTIKEDYIKIHKEKTGKYTFNEIKDKINFDEYIIYKGSRYFRRINKEEYNKYAQLFLTKINIDEEVDILNKINEFVYLTKNPHPDIKKLKIIDDIN